MQDIWQVEAISALKDIYIWALHNDCDLILVDPGEASPALYWMASHAYTLQAIWLTHHHSDHSGGIERILNNYPVPVVGSAISPYPRISHPIHEGGPCPSPATACLEIPGHTDCHIAFLCHDYLFCGDTLFSAGCGRNFEGNIENLYQSLQKLSRLPDHTAICAGHEYTYDNLAFAMMIDPNNTAIHDAMHQVATRKGSPSLPTTLRHEKAINPFLRCHHETIQKAASAYHGASTLGDPLATFIVLRRWKNSL